MYIKSENIKIYPSSLRGAVDPEANLTAESSLTKFVSRCHRKSFVLDYSNDSLTFFVEGYFFKIDNVRTNLSSLSGNIYAHIRLNDVNVELYPTTTGLTANLRTLVNIDGSSILDDSTSSEFRGMIISTNTTESNATSSFHILTNTNGSFSVPDDSWVQLEGKAISVGGKLLSSLFDENGNVGHAANADYATNAGNASKLNNKSESELNVSHATNADNATTANNATNLGGNPSSYYASASSVTTLQSNLESGSVVVKNATNATNAENSTKLNGKEASYYATATSVNDTNAGLTETINRVSALENSRPSVTITVNDDGTANITFTNL